MVFLAQPRSPSFSGIPQLKRVRCSFCPHTPAAFPPARARPQSSFPPSWFGALKCSGLWSMKSLSFLFFLLTNNVMIPRRCGSKLGKRVSSLSGLWPPFRSSCLFTPLSDYGAEKESDQFSFACPSQVFPKARLLSCVADHLYPRYLFLLFPNFFFLTLFCSRVGRFSPCAAPWDLGIAAFCRPLEKSLGALTPPSTKSL